MLSLRSNVAFLMPPDPLRPQGYQDTLRATRPDNDPDAPPPKKPGESLIAGAAILGLLIGGVAGFLLSFRFVGSFLVVLCTVGGVVAGGIVGTLIGDAIRKRRFKQH